MSDPCGTPIMDIPNAEYHAAGGVSSSFTKAVARSTLLHAKNGTKVISDNAARVGSALHSLALEPEKGEVLAMHDSERGKAWTSFKEKTIEEGRIPLTIPDFEKCQKMVQSLHQHEDIHNLLTAQDRVCEASLFAEYKGLTLKARPDLYTPNVMVDVKTTMSADPKQFMRQFFDLGYDLQIAHYKLVGQLCGLQWTHFAFACVEKEPPFASNLFIVGGDTLSRAERIVEETLDKIKEDEGNEHPTTGWPRFTTINLPNYLKEDF